MGDPLPGVGRVERYVRRPGLQDGEQGDDHVVGAGQADPDPGAGRRAGRAQHVGEPVGALVEFAVGQAGVTVLQRHRVGGRPGLGLELFHDGCVVHGVRGPVPADQHRPPLLRTERLQFVQGRVGTSDELLHQVPQPVAHGPYRRLVEEVRVVLDQAVQALGVPLEDEGQVVLGAVRGAALDAQFRVAVGYPSGVALGEHEHGLHERGVAAAARRLQTLDYLVEGRPLVPQRLAHLLPRPAEHVPDGHPVVDLLLEDDQVDEVADQSVGGRVVAERDGAADQHAPLTGVAGEEDRVRGDEGHEQGHPLGPGERLEVVGRGGRQVQREGAAPVLLHRGAGPVGGQVEHREFPGEPGGEVVEGTGEGLGVHQFPVPLAEVPVGGPQRVGLDGQTAAEAVVAIEEFPQEDTGGGGVGGDVVDVADDGRPVRGAERARHGDDRPAGQIEAEIGHPVDEGVEFLVVAVAGDLEDDRVIVPRDVLPEYAVAQGVGGAQDLLAAQHSAHGRVQAVGIG